MANKVKKYEYDFMVFIGRFQPFHNGHKHVIENALDKARHVIILIGSANVARNLRNPFKWEERAEMISASFNPSDQNRMHIGPVLDLPYAEDQWIKNVRMSAQGIIAQYQVSNNPKVGLIGHMKDQTSYYLEMFPEWNSENIENYGIIDATDIRTEYFANNGDYSTHKTYVPNSTISFLDSFRNSDEFAALVEEYRMVEDYKAQWKDSPFPPTFMTVDNVVTVEDHILMIKRKNHPGKGLWALPGGFLDPHETLQSGAIRELKEETKIEISEKELNSLVKSKEIFDDPRRSLRGRTITAAFWIELAGKNFPKVEAADDASDTQWMPIHKMSSDAIFEDHYHIIRHMLVEKFI